MTKRYVGTVGLDGWPGTVYVEEGAGIPRTLEHHVYHSPDGFSWGYSGSGPSELAKDMLWDYLGKQPEPGLYADFREAFIAPLDQQRGFTIEGEDIARWLVGYNRSADMKKETP